MPAETNETAREGAVGHPLVDRVCTSCSGPTVLYGQRCPVCGYGNWEYDSDRDRMMGRDSALFVRQGFQVGAGTRPGYVEVRFPGRPADTAIAELKAQGFRWTRFSGCWYGLAANLPARYQSEGFKAERARLDAAHDYHRDPGEDAADRWNEAQS